MVGRVGSSASGRLLPRGLRGIVAAAALATACAEAPTGKKVAAAPLAESGLRRLLPGPTSAGIPWTIDSAWHRAPLATSDPEKTVAPKFASAFEDDGAASAWRIDARFGALVDPSAPTRGVAPANVRDGALELPERASVAALVVAASPITPYVLTFRVRGAATGRETRLFVHEFAHDWSEVRDAARLLSETRAEGEVEEVLEVADVAASEQGDARGDRLLRPRRGAPDADGWTTWRVEWSSRWRTRSLALSFCGSSDGASAIDDVRLVELPARALLGLPAGAPENFDLPRPWESLDAARRVTKVRSEWESRRALLLPRGGKARATIAARDGAGGAGGRVELGLAIVREERLCAREPCRATVRVTWNGDVRDHPLELRFDAPTGWQEVVLPLPAGGGAATLAFEVLADPAGARDDDALIAVSDPLLFATDPAAAPAADAPWNVVIVSLDTLRADRLGRMRGGKSLTPRLDALAAESVRFTHALANASYTLPSHVSLFTGKRPGDHGVLTVFDAFDGDHSANLARLLAERGWATAAFTSGGMLNAVFCGIDVGFDRYGEIDALLTPDDRLRDSSPLQQRAAWNRALAQRRRLDADVLPWLRGHRGAPFLLFLHSYLTHNYQPEPALRAEFTRGLPATPLELHGAAPYRHQLCSDYLATGVGKGDRRFEFHGDGRQEFVAERDLPWLEALYDATVAQADRDVGRLLDALEQQGLAQRTIVVVTSDHGEEFLEHGDLSHARTLFDEILRVPLLIRVPGIAPRVVDEPVELIDVAPTLLARLGLAADPRMRGDDLLADGFEARRVTIHEGAGGVAATMTRRAARMRDGKLVIVSPLAARGDGALSSALQQQLGALGYLPGHDGRDLPPELAPEYYDLALDPREQRDLAHDEARTKPQSLRMGELAQELGAAPFGKTRGE